MYATCNSAMYGGGVQSHALCSIIMMGELNRFLQASICYSSRGTAYICLHDVDMMILQPVLSITRLEYSRTVVFELDCAKFCPKIHAALSS